MFMRGGLNMFSENIPWKDRKLYLLNKKIEQLQRRIDSLKFDIECMEAEERKEKQKKKESKND